MSAWLVGFVGVIYAGVAWHRGWVSDWPDALIFIGYTIANGGFVWKYMQ